MAPEKSILRLAVLIPPPGAQISDRRNRTPEYKVIRPNKMRQKRRKREIDECRDEPAAEQPKYKRRTLQPALHIVQILHNLIEIAVLGKIFLHPMQSIHLRRKVLRHVRRLIQRNLCRHFAPALRRRIRNKAPCIQLVIDECALAAVRTDAREPLDLCSAILANHLTPPYCRNFIAYLTINDSSCLMKPPVYMQKGHAYTFACPLFHHFYALFP